MANESVHFAKSPHVFPSVENNLTGGIAIHKVETAPGLPAAPPIRAPRPGSLQQSEPEVLDSDFKQRSIMKKKIARRQSFSMCQTKYGDAQKLKHPLKEKKGPILNDESTIAKMKEAQRFPIPEKLLHRPMNFDLYIDSLMHAAYNSDENEEWSNLK